MTEPLSRDELLARARQRDLARDHRGALEDYGRLAEIEPENPEPLLERGRLRWMLGEAEAARADFLRASLLRPGDPRALHYVAYSRAPLEPAAAQDDYRAAVAAEAKDPEGFYFRALSWLALGDGLRAHADFAEAARRASKDDPRLELYQDKADETEPFSLPRSVRQAPASWALAALNVAVMLVFRELLSDPSSEELMRRGAVERYSVRAGEPWRLLTAVFLHIGAFHLVWNVYGGLALCAKVEQALGSFRFLAAYLACGVFASAASVLGHHVVSAGSSGALFGVIGLLAVQLLRQRRKAAMNRRLRRLLWSVGVWFVVGFFASFDNWAHGGGLVFGLVLGFLLLPSAAPVPRRLGWALAALLWIGVVGAAILGPSHPLERQAAELARLVHEARARGDLPEAERLLGDSLGKGLDDAWIRLTRGSLRESRGDLPGAREDYLAVVAVSEHPHALWGLANVEVREGRHAQGLGYYDRALAREPASPELLLNRAFCLQALGRFPEARRDVESALRSAPREWPQRSQAEEFLRELR